MVWVNGLKNRGGTGAWQQILLDRVEGRWASQSSSPNTLRAEAGLHLPESVYFYLWSTNKDYGAAVLVYKPAGLPDGFAEGCVVPFDSGGFYSGTHFKAKKGGVELEVASRQAWFEARRTLFERAEAEFKHCISDCFSGRLTDYIEGTPPTCPWPMDGYVLEPPSVYTWIWEAHLLKASADACLLDLQIFIGRDNADAIEKYMLDHGILATRWNQARREDRLRTELGPVTGGGFRARSGPVSVPALNPLEAGFVLAKKFLLDQARSYGGSP